MDSPFFCFCIKYGRKGGCKRFDIKVLNKELTEQVLKMDEIIDGRQNSEQITVFDATGTALLDILTAKHALKKADELGLGQDCHILFDDSIVN